MLQSPDKSILNFLRDCATFMPPDCLFDAPTAQARYGKNSVGHVVHIGGALHARNEADVVSIVALANRYKVKLYPISLGHNWGYGGPTPHVDDCVVLDLHRMNRVLSADPTLGIATVEPGVSAGELYAYLAQRQLDYLVPIVGSGTDTSIIGNALERGYGIVPYADHFQAVLSLRAVLPDGRIYESALDATPGTETGQLFKWGVGPYLDGIFSQGSYGVITQMTIALAPKPESQSLCILELDEEYPDAAVTFVREASRRYGVHLSPFIILNRDRYLAANPHVRPADAPAWTVLGTIHGDQTTTRHIGRQIKRMAGGFRKRLVLRTSLVRRLIHLYQALPRPLRSERRTRELLHMHDFMGFLEGKPSNTFLNTILYDGKGKQPLNPDQDGKGVLWYAPLIPMRSEDLRRFLAFAEPIMTSHGMGFSITFFSFGWRCFDCTLFMKYDRTLMGAEDNARRCYEALFLEGKKRGFMPYRVGLQGMSLLVDHDQPFWQLAREIKHAIDPNEVLSAHRYY